MKALVKKQKGKGFVEIMECAKPLPSDNEVLIKVAYTGICGTDIHILNDEFPFSKGTGVGIITKISRDGQLLL